MNETPAERFERLTREEEAALVAEGEWDNSQTYGENEDDAEWERDATNDN